MDSTRMPAEAINLSELSFDEQEAFLDQLEALQDQQSQAEEAFFADRRRRGLGVGMDPDGRLVYGASFRRS